MNKETHTRGDNLAEHTQCRICGDQYPMKRWALGYKMCCNCGEQEARKVVRTIVPMHKSNYFFCTDLTDLKGINNKGGMHR